MNCPEPNRLQRESNAHQVLNDVFKLDRFRDGQEAIIRDVLSGHDTLAVMPTGSGKSLCYQLPGFMIPGLTLIISPLIALMKDQIDSLLARGIPAAGLNALQTLAQQHDIIDAVVHERIKFLYVAPERMKSSAFLSLMQRVKIGLLAVDEAHCISQWGHDFRPDYRRIGALRQSLGNPTTIALTATASTDVQRDIVEQLHFVDPHTHILGFDRKNLLYGAMICRTKNEKYEFILNFIRNRIQRSKSFSQPCDGCGIIYAATISQVEDIAQYLADHGLSVGAYHAKLQPRERSHIQELFMDDAFHCLVATTAFGMGVDKKDIRYVLHVSMSSSVEAYTQEAGRAGRDGKPATCIMLYSKVDAKIQSSFIDNAYPGIETYQMIFAAFAEASRSKLPKCGAMIDSTTFIEAAKSKHRAKLNTAFRQLLSQEIVVRAPAHDNIDPGTDPLIRNDPTPATTFKRLCREDGEQKKVAENRLSSLLKYIYSDRCRTKFVLDYFGSAEAKRVNNCHHCDICNAMSLRAQNGSEVGFPPEPLHFVLIKCMCAAFRAQKARLQATHRDLANMLTAHTEDPRYMALSTYGILSYFDPRELLIVFGKLVEAGILSRNPTNRALSLNDAYNSLLHAQSLDPFPTAIQSYMVLRFPKAVKSGNPWQNAST